MRKDTLRENLEYLLGNLLGKYHFKIHNAYNLSNAPNWQIPERTIQDWMLVYARGGKGCYKINGTVHPIEEGKIFLISHDTPHSAGQVEASPASVIAIRFGLYDNISGEAVTNKLTPMGFSCTVSRTYYYQQLFEGIYKYFKLYPENLASTLCNAFLCEIFSMLYIILFAGDSSIPDRKMSSAKLFIEENILSGITLQRAAEHVELSPKYFSKQFKKQFNMTFKEFLYRAKIDYAKVLLQETGYSIKKIALLLGYSDQYIFSNQFKKETGMPPSKKR